MSIITNAEAFLIDIPVETVRTDSVQAFLKQETLFVKITTADGNTGVGYSYTIGTGGTGGSGVVILSTNRAASSTTGSPVVTTSGANTIYQFNNTGSITF